MCWRKQIEVEVEVVPKVCLLQLSLLFPISLPCALYQNYVSSHVFYVTKRTAWFLGFSISGLGTPPKLKTDTISCSPVAYQFLRCCPPGLGQSAKITWKLWLVQPPVRFIFVLFPFPLEFWVVLWKGGNHGEGLEAAILGHSLSGVYGPKYIFLYFQFNLFPWL